MFVTKEYGCPSLLMAPYKLIFVPAAPSVQITFVVGPTEMAGGTAMIT